MANWSGDSALVFLLLRASWPRAGGRFIANENHICLWRQSIRRPCNQSASGLANAAGREIAPDRSKFTRDQCQRQRKHDRRRAALVPNLLDGVVGDPKLNLPDRIHPNAAGHKILVENVWRVLEPIAREIATKPANAR